MYLVGCRLMSDLAPEKVVVDAVRRGGLDGKSSFLVNGLES